MLWRTYWSGRRHPPCECTTNSCRRPKQLALRLVHTVSEVQLSGGRSNWGRPMILAVFTWIQRRQIQKCRSTRRAHLFWVWVYRSLCLHTCLLPAACCKSFQRFATTWCPKRHRRKRGETLWRWWLFLRRRKLRPAVGLYWSVSPFFLN